MRVAELAGGGVALLLCGCAGANSPSISNCTVAVLTVTPSVATVDHGMQAPGNQQTFTATRVPTNQPVSSSCVSNNVISQVMWTSSDTVNVQLVSNPDTSTVTATCVGATAVPVTITATQFASGLQSPATATLTCK